MDGNTTSQWDEELIAKIVRLGGLGYLMQKCRNVLQLEEKDWRLFEEDFYNPNSEIAQAYAIGKDVVDFELDSKLLQLAKSGEIKAIQTFNKKRLKYQIQTPDQDAT